MAFLTEKKRKTFVQKHRPLPRLLLRGGRTLHRVRVGCGWRPQEGCARGCGVEVTPRRVRDLVLLPADLGGPAPHARATDDAP